VAAMVLFALVNAPIVLVSGRLAPWTPLADAHRLLLTSVPGGSILVHSNTALFHEHDMDSPTRESARLSYRAYLKMNIRS
jgi:hypothetical protein